jgi:ribose/xylose/arabinose/galactoside ABC-type transport system permease subunit
MKKKGIHFNFGEWGILYALIVFWLILIIFRPDFRYWSAFQSIMMEASITAICAIGMTFSIISGDFDLSVAGEMAVCGVTLTLILPKVGLFGTIIIILATGCAMGLINGLMIAKLKIPAFVTTLAMYNAYRAVAQLINDQPVVVQNQAFGNFSTSYILGFPSPFVVMVACALIGTLILRKTAVGRNILAIGNSKEAAKISGISVANTQIVIYLLVGLFAAAAGIVATSYLHSSNYGMEDGFEFTVISAVVLGGTALIGGKGSIFTSVIASLFLATITAGMDAFQIDSYSQRIVNGVILIIAFSINGIREIVSNSMVRRRARKELRQRLASGQAAA